MTLDRILCGAIRLKQTYDVYYRSVVYLVAKALRDDASAVGRVPVHGEQQQRITSNSCSDSRKTTVYSMERHVRRALGLHTVQI